MVGLLETAPVRACVAAGEPQYPGQSRHYKPVAGAVVIQADTLFATAARRGPYSVAAPERLFLDRSGRAGNRKQAENRGLPLIFLIFHSRRCAESGGRLMVQRSRFRLLR